MWSVLALLFPGSLVGCTAVCSGATCADSYTLADLRGLTGPAGAFDADGSDGHIIGQSGEGRARALARVPAFQGGVGEPALLVGIPDGSRVVRYGRSFYLGTEDAALAGEPGDGFGAAVSARTQLVVGAPRAGAGPLLPSVGRVYMFPYDRPDIGSSLADADTVVTGTAAAEGLGATVAACGDMDGDGAADALAAAPDADRLAGRVVRIPGGAGQVDADALEQWTGTAPGTLLGASLGCGDFDGDGLDDAVIGEPYADGTAGEAAGVVRIEGRDGPLFRLEGSTANAYFGAALVVADVDGDGLDDVVVGASGRSGAGAADDALAGAVHVYSGVWLRAGVDMFGAAPLLEGVDPRGRLGSALAVGDVDADGVGDVVIGAPGDTTTAASAGAAYVLSGPLGGVTAEHRALEDAVLTVVGARGYQRVGESLALANLDAVDGDDTVFTTREQP